MDGPLVVAEGARMPSEHYPTKPKKAHIGPWDKLVTHPGVDPGFAPERDKLLRGQNKLIIFSATVLVCI